MIFSLFKRINRKQIISKNQIDRFNNSLTHKTILIIGQSNAANYTEKKCKSKEDVFVFYKGLISKAKDPILGATGKRGSCWIPVAEQIMKYSKVESILISNIAEGSSLASDWTNEGRFNEKIHKVSRSLKEAKLEPDIILWQQGEQDNLLKTTKEKYKSNLKEIMELINSYFCQAKIFISITSFHPNTENKININIRKSQFEIISEAEYIFEGPDTDLIISKDDRYDLIHFSTIGSQKLSNMWSERIISIVNGNIV